MKATLEKLFDHHPLTKTEAYDVLSRLGRGEINLAQAAAFMTVYRMREITLEELRGFRTALLELAVPIALETQDATDMCGTGGDGRNTFNISTLSCFVVAAAGGRVIKHGNYGVSSVSGSSTVLEKLGYKFTNDNSALEDSLERCGVCFLHAPLFHPALKHVGEIRKSLGTRTFFNILGPLVNPAQPSHRLTGLFSNELLRKYHYLLQETNEKFMLVHSEDGYDEISLTAPFRITTREKQQVYSPREIGYPVVMPTDLFGGGTADEAAKIFLAIMQGSGTAAQNNVVAANAGFALYNLGIAQDVQTGIQLALETLQSRKAFSRFKLFMESSVTTK